MLSNETIKTLEGMGFNRWTKAGKDRLYINAEQIGLTVIRYNSGNVRYAEFNGSKISNTFANEMLKSACYIDVTTGSVFSSCYTLKKAVEEFLESIQTA